MFPAEPTYRQGTGTVLATWHSLNKHLRNLAMSYYIFILWGRDNRKPLISVIGLGPRSKCRSQSSVIIPLGEMCLTKGHARENINERFFDQVAALTLHPVTPPVWELSLNIVHTPRLASCPITCGSAGKVRMVFTGISTLLSGSRLAH